MEDARHPLGVPRRIVQDRIAAMRADVIERAHLRIVAANDDQRNPGRMIEKAVVEGRFDFGLVARDDPRRAKELFFFFLEDRVVGVHARIDEVRRRKRRWCVPLRGVLCHDRISLCTKSTEFCEDSVPAQNHPQVRCFLKKRMRPVETPGRDDAFRSSLGAAFV